MKKLILSLTLGLTFPAAHIFAGGLMSREMQEDKGVGATLENVPLPVVTKEILSRIVDEALKKFDWKTISNIARTSKAWAEFVKNHIGITAQERKIIEQYRYWLNNIEAHHFLVDWWQDYKRSPLSFNPHWLLSSVAEHASYEEKVQQTKQFIFVNFILNENVGLKAARIIINLFLEHGVDLHIRYGNSTCLLKTGEQFETLNLTKGCSPQITILEIIKKENAPFTQSLAMTKQENYCPEIIQALIEAITKQFTLKVSDLQISELLDAFGYIQKVEEPEREHLKQLVIKVKQLITKELANRNFEAFEQQLIQRIPHLQKSHLEEILAYIKNVEKPEVRKRLEALIREELEKRDKDTENNNNA